MRKKLPKILVTGGASFIGSEFVRQAVATGYQVVVIDKLTYAGDLHRLAEVKGKIKFYRTDICNRSKLDAVFASEKVQSLIHFAAETHVDRSILDATAFIQTNILGTQMLLDLSRKYKISRFVHISTDEVYGDIIKGKFKEDFPLKPNSPYAASKAAADLLIKSYVRTYGFPAIIVRPSNNYGPWQYPEKLIPLTIMKALKGDKIPVYGNGMNVREWLFVSDSAAGILKVLENGELGEVYNLGSQQEKHNIDVVKVILKAMGKKESLIEFVKDRAGHDLRYALESKKLFNALNWKPQVKFSDGIKLTVNWYLAHQSWMLSKWKDISKLYS